MEEPSSPKRLKTEHDQQKEEVIVAVEPVEEKLYVSEESAVDHAGPYVPDTSRLLPPNSKFHKLLQSCAYNGSDSDDDDEKDQAFRRKETTLIAQRAVKFFNNKNGTNYVVVEALFSRSVLFNHAIVCHANFTAKEENGTNSTLLFFAETLKYYGQGAFRVLDCINLSAFEKDLLCKGCVYCQEACFHPPMKLCQYGANEMNDHNKFLYNKVSDSGSSDSDEEGN
ncbi:unnamed protein product [Linum tenue]|uniref:DUF3615 domain-containing protein n=1 Tax=Linum tenue TaxID=586396 RepID=A0AAV0M0R9_9ROSI|nr:unnamed protein product [Linum tenue]